MKKLLIIAAAALSLAGCRHVAVETADWKASYFAACVASELQGLKVKAGENVALEIENVQSAIDPLVKEALEKAAEALSAAAAGLPK